MQSRPPLSRLSSLRESFDPTEVPRGRAMVFRPASGLCNNLEALVSTAMLAAASCRQLVIDWNDGNRAAAGGIAFRKLFQPPKGAVLLPQGVNLEMALSDDERAACGVVWANGGYNNGPNGAPRECARACARACAQSMRPLA